MKISLVTPCYNAEKYIRWAIESVIYQEGDFEIEYYIVDGNSTDRTLHIIKNYEKKISERSIEIKCRKVTLHVESAPDQGMYDALVKGFKKVKGDIIGYINADDMYQAGAFKTLNRIFKKYRRVKWLTGIATMYNEDGIIYYVKSPYFYYNRFIKMGMHNDRLLKSIQQESTFFKKELLQYVDFNRLKKLQFAGDYYLWYCFASYTPLFIVSAVLAGWRCHKKNKSLDMEKYKNEMNSFTDPISLTEKEKEFLSFSQKRWIAPMYTHMKDNKRYIYWKNQKAKWYGNLNYDIGYMIKFKSQITNNKENRGELTKRNNNTQNAFGITKKIHEESVHKIDESDEMKPKQSLTLSVVIPYYAKTDRIIELLISIKNQSKKLTECIICCHYELETDLKKLISTNQFDNIIFLASSGAKNDLILKGIKKSVGEIITWIDPEDKYCDNNVFSNVIEIFNLNKDSYIVYGGGEYINSNGKYINEAYINGNAKSMVQNLVSDVGIFEPSVFMRKEMLKKIGYINTNLEYTYDYEMWVKAAVNNFKFTFLPQKLTQKRIVEKYIEDDIKKNIFDEIFYIIDNYYGYIPIVWLKKYHSYFCKKEDYQKLLNLANIYNSSYYSKMNILKNDFDIAKIDTYSELKEIGFDFHNDCHEVDADYRENKKYVNYSIPGWGGKNFIFENDWIIKNKKKTIRLVDELKRQRHNDLCIIVGNGPSLKKENFDFLENQDVFISNNAFIDKKLLSFAKYYAVVNYLVAEQSKFEINKLSTQYKFYPYWLSYCLYENEKTIFLNADLEQKFGLDIRERLSWMSTVSFFMIQIAYSLGYKNIALIGFDHNYKQDKNVKEGDLIITNNDDENHFDPRYFKGKKWQAADVDNMSKAYKIAKETLEAKGVKIINATVGGNLEVFERDKLENIIKQ